MMAWLFDQNIDVYNYTTKKEAYSYQYTSNYSNTIQYNPQIIINSPNAVAGSSTDVGQSTYPQMTTKQEDYPRHNSQHGDSLAQDIAVAVVVATIGYVAVKWISNKGKGE